MAAGSVTRGGPGSRYRKRRPLPAIVLILLLGLAATFVWFKVIRTADTEAAEVHCDPPGPPVTSTSSRKPPPTLGQTLSRDALDKTAPEVPARARIRVLNATAERGKAGQVSVVLGELGFTKVVGVQNDPIYATKDLTCQAQIRFGQQGMAAARTLHLIEPCAELVKDKRTDSTVDLVVGEKFGDLRPSQQARKLLEDLTQWAQTHPATHGGLQDAQAQRPQVDPKLVAEAQQARC